MPTHWSAVTIGIESFAAVSELWIDQFGFEVCAERTGDDAALAELWSLPEGNIEHQWLLAAPGQTAGYLHCVRFADTPAAVREGAQTFDLCPKNLDIYVDDIATRVADLKAAGFRFRNDEHSDIVAPDGTRFREIHLPAHDGLNIVLLEVVGKALAFSDKGFLGVGPLVTTVADISAERAFYETAGFEPLAHNVLSGPEIETMIGLPQGASLDIAILGETGNPLGEIEIVQYGGTDGSNLYPRTRAPARGILEIHCINASVEGPACATLVGQGAVHRQATPAGFVVNHWAQAANLHN